jgi:hypothetical protein
MKNTEYTVEELQGMNSTDLRKAGTILGIKNSKTYKKVELLKLAIDIVDFDPDGLLDSDLSTPELEESVVEEETTLELGTLPECVDKFDLTNITKDEIAEIYFDKTLVRKGGTENKSEKFRRLHKGGIGLRKSEIVKLFNSHYSYVGGVIDAMNRKERES